MSNNNKDNNKDNSNSVDDVYEFVAAIDTGEVFL